MNSTQKRYIRENIAIAHPNASSEEIIQAAKYPKADEFIQKLPMGYELNFNSGDTQETLLLNTARVLVHSHRRSPLVPLFKGENKAFLAPQFIGGLGGSTQNLRSIALLLSK